MKEPNNNNHNGKFVEVWNTIINWIKGNKVKTAIIIFVLILGFSSVPGEKDKSESKDTKKETKIKKESETKREVTKQGEENSGKDQQSHNKNNEETNSDIQENIKPKNNTVYGKLTDTKAKEVAGMYSNQEDDLNYIVGDNKEILQIEKSFEDLPLDENIDQSLIKEHTLDYMEDDASIKDTISDSEFEYYSPSTDKTYNVVYEKNDESKIINIIISSF
ncbi:hypothetical protein [Staphylococcus nepalensis]|uniref:hypothetical protein n=1 Tax=Staphylococcus nepalensis TaxID=214473 RepID=UPI0011CBA166|nr:hypothetical protein [Staphylococcus nepalensis]